MTDLDVNAHTGAQPLRGGKWTHWWRTIQAGIRLLPIVGHLPNCTWRDHASALKEFSITILFGTATFWVTALLLKSFTAYSADDFLYILYKTTNSGQLFIFSVGMLGPILLASAVEPPNTKQFPGRLGHFALILLLGALASGFYAAVLAGREPNAAGLVDTDFLYRASLVIAVGVVIMRYLTTVYRRNTSNFDAEERLKAPENNFAAEFSARHAVDPLATAQPSMADVMADRFNNRGTQ